MRRLFLLALLFFSAVSSADSVNKCKDAKGHVIYQSDPCEKSGSHFVKSVSGADMNSAESAGWAKEKQLRSGFAVSEDTALRPRALATSPVPSALPSQECLNLRGAKKNNERQGRINSTNELKQDHTRIVRRMMAIGCLPD